jgi:hypothetical protein
MKNHYIPQTYLRRWAADDGKLCQHQKIRGHVIYTRLYPSQTGFIHDIYTVPELADADQHYVEDVLMRRVDQDAANGLDIYLSDDINAGMDETAATGWSRFLMSLLHRHPAKVAHLKVLAHERYEETLPAMRNEWDFRDGQTFDEYIAEKGAAISATLFVNVLAKICNSANIGQHMNNMRKSVITIQDDKRFLTCDNPLILFRPLDDPGAYVMLPISPKKMFIATNTEEVTDILFDRMLKEDLVEQLNQSAISNAYRYVYDTHEDQSGLVEKYFQPGA